MTELSNNTGGLPTISVDRTIAQYVSPVEGGAEASIDFDLGEISRFYGQLNFGVEAPLEKCHIHFSGLNVTGRDGMPVYGARKDEAPISCLDPQAPDEADIIIFAGTALKRGVDVNDILGRELVRQAGFNPQYHTEPLSKRLKEAEDSLPRLTVPETRKLGLFIATWITWCLTQYYIEVANLPINTLEDVATLPPIVAALVLANRALQPARRKKISVYQSMLEGHRANQPEALMIAGLAADLGEKAITLNLRQPLPEIIDRVANRSNEKTRKSADKRHLEASIGKPVRND